MRRYPFDCPLGLSNTHQSVMEPSHSNEPLLNLPELHRLTPYFFNRGLFNTMTFPSRPQKKNLVLIKESSRIFRFNNLLLIYNLLKIRTSSSTTTVGIPITQ